MKIYSNFPNPLAVFCLNLIVDAMAKNSSRTEFGENIGFKPGLI
jgi:hypothetical protein